jgi:hypothetical protein
MKDTKIVEIIGQFVDLEKQEDLYLGLCPFHVEKTPSFAVHLKKHNYHCFGCGVGGNTVRFLMDYKGISEEKAMGLIEEEVFLSDKTGYISNSVKEKLKEGLSRVSYETWIEPLRLRKITDKTAYFIAQNYFSKDWVENRYLPVIKKALSEVIDEELEIEIE